ncbi:MAG: hypothetical protein LLG01_12405 [Planctomycetaceae bacterium]|nr:hypothetical protein [Planctomycetaceae bacterium]
MKNSQNILIAALVLSAVVLSAIVLSTFMQTSQPAQAGTVFARYYGMAGTVGQVAVSADALYLIDIDSKRLNAYALDPGKGTIELLDSVDLAQAFR